MSHRLRLTAEKVAQRLRLISGQVACARVPPWTGSAWRFCQMPPPRRTCPIRACEAQGPLLELGQLLG